MNEDFIEVIRKAVQEGFQARSKFFESLEEPNEQELGPPVPEETLIHVEKVLGIDLPPSYRIFLSQYDGWKMIDGATDIYSCSELIKVAKSEDTKEWRQIAKDSGDDFADNCIVIGGSKFSASKYLLDPSRENESGEFAVIEYEKGIEEIHENFLQFLHNSLAEFSEAANEIEAGFDFEDI